MSTPHDLELQRILQAREEVGSTAVRPAVARALVVVFLLTLVLVPVIDQLRGGVAAAAAERLAAALGHAGEELAASRSMPSAVAANRALLAQIEVVEDELEEGSPTARTLRPWLQGALTGALGSGNEEALVGRDGWLFFRPDVEYLTGPGFLEPRVLEGRARGGKSWRRPPQPDPRPALTALAGAFAERGVAFFLLPTAVKPMAHPDRLSSRYPATAEDEASPALQNSSWERFAAELERAGVEILAPPPATFLRTDSHWTPDSVDITAAAIAARITDRGLLPEPEATATPWRRRQRTLTATGDLAGMLTLPPSWDLLAPETVTVERVEDDAGDPWSSDPAAPVLLLGDSFTNVYSRPDLGWGDAAGLAEQLSFHLGRPVDVLAVNDGTDLEVRRRLSALAPERLAPKRVVIYQLALRELAFGDWQPVEPPLPPPVPAAAQAGTAGPVENPVESPGESIRRRVRASIGALAQVPDPAATPYREAILALRLENVRWLDGDGPREILVYAWGMRDRSLTGASRWLPGRTVELELKPWAAVAPELETFQRLELDDERALFLDAYWYDAP